MTTYKLTHEAYVIRDEDTKVPIADTPLFPNTNPEYLDYKQWLADGGVPLPPEPARPHVPASVTMRQARLALLGAGLLASVDAAIDGLPGPQKEAARIEWEYATEVQRLSGLVPMMGAALGLDDAALDALFVAAVAL